MVSIKSLFISAALAASAYGRIGGFTVPDTVQAGQNITATLTYRGSLTNWNDFGVSQPSLGKQENWTDKQVIWGLLGAGESIAVSEQHYIGHFLSHDPI